jgi:hypothetical protein
LLKDIQDKKYLLEMLSFLWINLTDSKKSNRFLPIAFFYPSCKS